MQLKRGNSRRLEELHKEFHNLYYILNIVRVNRWRRMKCAGYLACTRKVYNILSGKFNLFSNFLYNIDKVFHIWDWYYVFLAPFRSCELSICYVSLSLFNIRVRTPFFWISQECAWTYSFLKPQTFLNSAFIWHL